MNLTQQHCKPCDSSMPPMKTAEVQSYLQQVNKWNLHESKISKKFTFKDFVESMRFVNEVAHIAEEEGHHPDIEIHYNRVNLTLFTHAISGLSPNDFIVAAKIDKLPTP